MKSGSSYPLARSERLVIENVGDETVIYDLDTKVAHALKPLAAAVFMYADGKSSATEIAELAAYRLGTPVTEAEVADAIEQLDSLALLDTPELAAGNGLSRRDALKVFAAAGVGTMLITSVAAPFAMADVASDYSCSTGDGDITGEGASYPQPWASMGTINPNTYGSSGTWTLASPHTVGGPTSSSGSYDLGQPCYITAPTSGTVCDYTYDGTQYSTTEASTSGSPSQCSKGFYVTTSGAWDANWTGSGTAPSNACVYDSTVIPTSDVSMSQCTLGFYVNGSGNWVANAPSSETSMCTVSGTNYFGVPSSSCKTNELFCVNSSDVFQKPITSGNCSAGQTKVTTGSSSSHITFYASPVTGDWDAFVTGIPTTGYTGGTQGVYQCLPCDGSITEPLGWDCCEAVCGPSPALGYVSGSVAVTAAGGYGPYDETSCQVWGTHYNGTDFCTSYPGKWCKHTSG